MRREQTKPLKDLLAEYIKEAGLQEGLNGARVLGLWDEMQAPCVLQAVAEKFFKGGKLYLRLSSSSVRNYLFTDRQHIMTKMNQALGEALVKDIVLL